MSLVEQIDPLKVPRHVAIIMDGNGRWARSQGQERIFGHLNGVGAVRESLKAAVEIGVEYLTLYAFSTENWNRPKEEVDALMDLLVDTILRETDELQDNGVRLLAIGDLNNLPEACRENLERAEKITSGNKKITLILALSYSSRREIVTAVKDLIRSGTNPDEIDEAAFGRALSTGNWPDPELLIRTSGEKRISNFLLWQIAYSELYFTEVFWPEFNREEFYKAILEYQHRERRFGKTSEQLALK
jgi:undecaprenyl diphosphate synthase